MSTPILETLVLRATTKDRAHQILEAQLKSPYHFPEVIHLSEKTGKQWNMGEMRNKQLWTARRVLPEWTLIVDADCIIQKFDPTNLPKNMVVRALCSNYSKNPVNVSWFAINKGILFNLPNFNENYHGGYWEDIEWMRKLGTSHLATADEFLCEHIPHELNPGQDESYKRNQQIFNERNGEIV